MTDGRQPAAAAPAIAVLCQCDARSDLHSGRRWSGGGDRPVGAAASSSDRSRRFPNSRGIVIGTFDNLTGEPVLDDDVAQIGLRLANALGTIRDADASGASGSSVSGTVQEVNGRFVLRAMPGRARNNGVVWTTTHQCTDRRHRHRGARQRWATCSPRSWEMPAGRCTHRARAWLKLQTALPEHADGLCLRPALHELARQSAADRCRSGRCLLRQVLVGASPDDALALAAPPDMRAWRTQFLATPS